MTNTCGELETSDDPNALMRAAVACAASAKAEDHQALVVFLSARERLGRLDNPDAYAGPPNRLRLARVLKTLMENTSPGAAELLTRLTREPEFLARDERQWLLIRALAAVHPPSSTALAFWEDHCRPSAVYLSVAITALADNDSPEALALLERKMADEQIAAGLKIAWMRRAILSHRHEREMLHCCGRMLAAASDPELRRALVEALFDYQQSWYGSRPPEPIPLNAMDRQSRKILRIVGEHALKSVPLGAELRRKVECVLGEIRRTDETT